MGFDDLSDDEKQKLLATMKSGQQDSMSNGEFQQNEQQAPPQAQSPAISTPGDYLKQGFGWYDKNVANRPRAAALAALQGHSPIQAATDNQPVSGQDIAREGFKTLNPELTQTTNPSNVLMKQGDALKSAVPAVGFATEVALDPMTYLPGAGEANGMGMAAKVAPEVAEQAPKAEYAAKAFLQKSGPEAESFASRTEQLDQLNQDMINAEQKVNSFKDNPHSPKAQLAMDKFNRLRDKFQKYNQMYQRQRQD